MRLVADPLAVGTDVGREALRALVVDCLVLEGGVDRLTAGELWRDLDQRLVDEDGDRVEVRGVGLEPEPLGLERDRAAPGERIEMPLTFFVSPDMVNDRDASGIRDITLSYTFFRLDGRRSASADAGPSARTATN